MKGAGTRPAPTYCLPTINRGLPTVQFN
jgi:hypothetical protein